MATQHAYKTLKAGFTTVRQVGDSGMVAISLRDAINAGHVIGPRIFTSGKSIATTGGHADPTNGMASELIFTQLLRMELLMVHMMLTLL